MWMIVYLFSQCKLIFVFGGVCVNNAGSGVQWEADDNCRFPRRVLPSWKTSSSFSLLSQFAPANKQAL